MKKTYQPVFVLAYIVFVLSACNNKTKVDYIVTNAQVYTFDSSFSKTEAFAVKDGKFAAIGKTDSLMEIFDADTIINMLGAYVYPGLIDAHCHFYGYGAANQQADLSGTKSFDEVLKRVSEFAKTTQNEWIQGRGWDQNDWDVKQFPDKQRLDSMFPNRPVALKRIDGHAMLVNSAALKRAGITQYSFVAGGEIKKGYKYEPTGILIDKAMDLIDSVIPKRSRADIAQALLKAQDDCIAVGLTSIHDAGLDYDVVQVIDSLNKAGKLHMRIYAMLSPNNENFEQIVKRGAIKTDYLNVRSIKVYADGALGSRGACLLHPYSDDKTNTGFLLETPQQLTELFNKAYLYGYQCNTHAIGDSANRFVLKEYAKILGKNNNRRWRIEHAQVVHTDDRHFFGDYQIIPSVQPTHATSDMYWVRDRIGSLRVEYAYSYNSLLQQNNLIAAGSDFPVESINPLLGYYAAISRRDVKGFPPRGFLPEQAITRQQALLAATLWAAYAAFEENEKGTIEVGKFADFVTTEYDLLTVSDDLIPNVTFANTYIGGKKVYSRTGSL